MQDPELTVAAVAEQVGFNHYGLFTHAFKSVTGVTLTEYRFMQAHGKH